MSCFTDTTLCWTMAQYEQHRERLDGAFLELHRKREVDRLRCWLWDISEGSPSFLFFVFLIPHSERPSGSRKRCSETDCLDPYGEIDSWQVSQWLPRRCRCLCAHVSLCVERSVLVCADNAACVWLWGISCLRVRWVGGLSHFMHVGHTLVHTPVLRTPAGPSFYTEKKTENKKKRSFYTSNLNILCRGKKSKPSPTLIFYSSWYVTPFAPACDDGVFIVHSRTVTVVRC